MWLAVLTLVYPWHGWVSSSWPVFLIHHCPVFSSFSLFHHPISSSAIITRDFVLQSCKSTAVADYLDFSTAHQGHRVGTTTKSGKECQNSPTFGLPLFFSSVSVSESEVTILCRKKVKTNTETSILEFILTRTLTGYSNHFLVFNGHQEVICPPMSFIIWMEGTGKQHSLTILSVQLWTLKRAVTFIHKGLLCH